MDLIDVDHLKKAGLNYPAHLFRALFASGTLVLTVVVLVVHAFIPWFLPSVATTIIKDTHDILAIKEYL